MMISEISLILSILLCATHPLVSTPVGPLPVQEPQSRFSRHIVAIGDLHGDIQVAKDIFRAAGVTDSKDRWSGKIDTLVQLGDITDR